MNDIKAMQELYRKYWDCMISKDIAGLDAIMSDDYVLVHMTGKRQDKADFFNSLRYGELNYYSAEHDEITAEVTGDRATLTGKSRIVAAVYGGGKSLWRLRGDFTLRRENGQWKLVSSRASTY